MESEAKSAFRAGLFIIATLAVFVWLIFIMGSKKGIFGEQYTLRTEFDNVQGLVVGAPVRLAGVKVGLIEAIDFPKAIDEKIRVTLRIDDAAPVHKRIREDSEASIRSLGPLGEKYIEVTVGAEKKASLKDGDKLAGQDPLDFYTVMDIARVEFQKLTRITSEFEKILKDFRETEVLESLGGAVKSLRSIADEVVEGKGLLHSLIYDPARKRILDNVTSATQSFSQITREIAEGGGSLHSLIYEKEVAKISENLALMTGDLHQLVKDVKEGTGSLHSLIYDKEVQGAVVELRAAAKELDEFAKRINKGKVAESLVKAAANLQKITQQIANGEGTLGALVTDPTVYDRTEDLLGGAQRSWLLRKAIKSSLDKAKKPKKDKPAAEGKKE